MYTDGAFSLLLLLATLFAGPVQEVASVAYGRTGVGRNTRRQSSGYVPSGAVPRVVSPCPGVLSNIKVTRNRGRWYGLISVTPQEEATGVVLDILLDKAAESIVSPFGEVFSDDNIVYTIRNDNRQVEPGQVIPIRFFVKYSRQSSSPPNVEAIAFNGRQICPAEQVSIPEEIPPSTSIPDLTPTQPPPPVTPELPKAENTFGRIEESIPEEIPPSAALPDLTPTQPPPPVIPELPNAENTFGRIEETIGTRAALPLGISAAKSSQQGLIQVANDLREAAANEYEIELKGHPEKLIGRLSETPELYIINGEFKIKSNASLLILLIARPPNMPTLDQSIFGVGTSTAGEKIVGSSGKGKSIESQTTETPAGVVPPQVFVGRSKDHEGFATSESTGFQVSSTEHSEEESLFTSIPESSTLSEDQEEQTITTTESPPTTVAPTTELISSEPESITERHDDRVVDPTQWTSPCPKVFSYDVNSIRADSWNGIFALVAKEDLLGIRLDVELDKPSRLRIAGTLFEEVDSKYDTHFSTWNYSALIRSGEAINADIFAQFDPEEGDPPRIKSMRFNGRLICRERKVIPTVTATSASSVEDTSEVIGPSIFIDTINDGASTNMPELQPDEPVISTSTEETQTEEAVFGDKSVLPNGGSTAVPEKGIPEPEVGETCGRMLVEQTPMASYEQRTMKGQWPWHAAIYQLRGDDRFYICGGTLIGKQSVLTAARCLSDGRPAEKESLVVYLGMYTLHQWSQGLQLKEVQEVYVNPDYNSTNLNGNLAILRLSSPVELTDYIQPVCLWDGKSGEPNDIRGEEGVVSGWGYDKYGLLEDDVIITKMPVLYQRACLWNYPELFRYLSESIYCAGYRSETTICNGESGDGMFFPSQANGTAADPQGDSPTWTIRGVASFALSPSNGIECSAKNYVVFTDVTKYQRWIEQYR